MLGDCPKSTSVPFAKQASSASQSFSYLLAPAENCDDSHQHRCRQDLEHICRAMAAPLRWNCSTRSPHRASGDNLNGADGQVPASASTSNGLSPKSFVASQIKAWTLALTQNSPLALQLAAAFVNQVPSSWVEKSIGNEKESHIRPDVHSNAACGKKVMASLRL